MFSFASSPFYSLFCLKKFQERKLFFLLTFCLILVYRFEKRLLELYLVVLFSSNRVLFTKAIWKMYTCHKIKNQKLFLNRRRIILSLFKSSGKGKIIFWIEISKGFLSFIFKKGTEESKKCNLLHFPKKYIHFAFKVYILSTSKNAE